MHIEWQLVKLYYKFTLTNTKSVNMVKQEFDLSTEKKKLQFRKAKTINLKKKKKKQSDL